MILITQSAENLDKRIRANVEILRKHTNIANASKLTRTLSLFLGHKLFIANDFYAGYSRGSNVGSHWILARRSLTRYYNTFQIVDDVPEDKKEEEKVNEKVQSAVDRKITYRRPSIR